MSTVPPTNTSAAPAGDDFNFGAELTRVEELLAEIERPDVDIDSLQANVNEAAQRIQMCKAKLAQVAGNVQASLAAVEQPPQPPQAT